MMFKKEKSSQGKTKDVSGERDRSAENETAVRKQNVAEQHLAKTPVLEEKDLYFRIERCTVSCGNQ